MRNRILEQIVLINNGTIVNRDRNSLLRAWLESVGGVIPDPYPNSVWNEDGTFNCQGIFYCDQPIPCGITETPETPTTVEVDEYLDSVWNEDGSFNCQGIFYCEQPIPCTPAANTQWIDESMWIDEEAFITG